MVKNIKLRIILLLTLSLLIYVFLLNKISDDAYYIGFMTSTLYIPMFILYCIILRIFYKDTTSFKAERIIWALFNLIFTVITLYLSAQGQSSFYVYPPIMGIVLFMFSAVLPFLKI